MSLNQYNVGRIKVERDREGRVTKEACEKFRALFQETFDSAEDLAVSRFASLQKGFRGNRISITINIDVNED